MRIGVDAREWAPGRYTGIGRFLETVLRRALSTRPGLGWTLFLHPGYERRVTDDSIAYLEMPVVTAPLVDQRTIPKLLRADPHDLFFSPYAKGPWNAPCPTIVVAHDMIPLVLPASWGGVSGLRRLWFRWYAARSARSATRVVTGSEAAAKDIVDYLRVPRERLTVIHDQVDPALLTLRSEGALGRLGIDGPFLLSVGRISAQKNQATLLRAWARIEIPDRARLVLAGAGPDRERLQALAGELEITDRVVWTGGVDDDVLAELYRNAKALLHPSVIEGFGLPVAEAMALGTPVVVSSGGSLPEVAGGAAPVLVADDVEAWAGEMKRFLTDDAYRDDWVAKVRVRARDFTPEQTTDRLLDVIEETARAG